MHWWISKWFLSFFSFLAIFCVGICWFNYYRRDYSYRDWARREAMLLLLEREEQVTKIKKLHAIRRLFLNLFITGFTLHQQKLRRPRKAWAAIWRRVGWCHRFDLEGRHWFSEKKALDAYLFILLEYTRRDTKKIHRHKRHSIRWHLQSPNVHLSDKSKCYTPNSKHKLV